MDNQNNQNNNTSGKRVYALYRVSTTGQVEKDDIPMQKQCCREFARQQGWTILREFAEKGVSGYKVSAKDRDAIQEIQRDAVAGKFDILLVFMFDRLGRKDDETPFVVEWFAKNGIHVWSAMEGEQRFDSHVDKLMNYIRYWQASGESLKTSMRTKTRLGQLTEEGHYTGGVVPYGYRAVDKGRVNKRNRPVLDLMINEEEAAVVRLIFHKYVHEGFGALRLCHYLNENGYVGRNGKNLANTTINRILKNPIYTGVLRNGESQSGCMEELRIIDDETFSRAQIILHERTLPHGEIPLNLSGRSLLVGKIHCAHCGNRLTLTTSGVKVRQADGSLQNVSRARYQCHYKVRHPGDCDGQTGYSMGKVDRVVEALVKAKLAEISAASEAQLLAGQHEKDLAAAKTNAERARAELRRREQELADLKAETLKVIRGDSKLSIDLLNSMVNDTEAAIREATERVQVAEQRYNALTASVQSLRTEYNRLLSWAELFENSSFEAKKMIVAQFIREVRVGRDYNIEIDFNVSFEEFQSYCEGGQEAQAANQ